VKAIYVKIGWWDACPFTGSQFHPEPSLKSNVRPIFADMLFVDELAVILASLDTRYCRLRFHQPPPNHIHRRTPPVLVQIHCVFSLWLLIACPKVGPCLLFRPREILFGQAITSDASSQSEASL
jgi:hypothetical protein